MDAWQWHPAAGGGWLMMVLMALVVFVVAALLVYGLFRSRHTTPEARPSGPKQLLQERYARGEIEREEYLRKLEDLER